MKPCGYCRRCLLHDDPGGCLEVEAWVRDRDARTLEVFEHHAPRVLANVGLADAAGRASARLMVRSLRRLRASVAGEWYPPEGGC